MKNSYISVEAMEERFKDVSVRVEFRFYRSKRKAVLIITTRSDRDWGTSDVFTYDCCQDEDGKWRLKTSWRDLRWIDFIDDFAHGRKSFCWFIQ